MVASGIVAHCVLRTATGRSLAILDLAATEAVLHPRTENPAAGGLDGDNADAQIVTEIFPRSFKIAR